MLLYWLYFTKSHYSECRYSECRNADCTIMLNVIILSVFYWVFCTKYILLSVVYLVYCSECCILSVYYTNGIIECIKLNGMILIVVTLKVILVSVIALLAQYVTNVLVAVAHIMSLLCVARYYRAFAHKHKPSNFSMSQKLLANWTKIWSITVNFFRATLLTLFARLFGNVN
jgi:hypothetical protein